MSSAELKLQYSCLLVKLFIGFANQLSGPALNQATTDITPTAPSTAAPSNRPNQQDYYKPKEYDPAAHVNPLIKPGKNK